MYTRLLSLWPALVAFSAIGFAADPVRVNPKPIETPSPSYPARLADTGKSGSAVIEMTVKADGSVADPVVKSADDPAFAEAALAVVPRWKFTPGTKDGAASDALVAIPFQFVPPIDQQINVALGRKVYVTLPETPMPQKTFGKLPKAVAKIQPMYPKALLKSRTEQTVEVQFVIAPDGSTLNPVVMGKPHKDLVVPAIASVAKGSFEPPMKDGKSVYVAASTKLRFAPPEPRNRGGGGGGGGDFGGGGGGGGGID